MRIGPVGRRPALARWQRIDKVWGRALGRLVVVKPEVAVALVHTGRAYGLGRSPLLVLIAALLAPAQAVRANREAADPLAYGNLRGIRCRVGTVLF